jgi:hypothetical protein
MNHRLFSRLLFSALALALSLLVSLPAPAQASCRDRCYDSCNLSFSDCSGFGLGDICTEQWLSCWEVCSGYTC